MENEDHGKMMPCQVEMIYRTMDPMGSLKFKCPFLDPYLSPMTWDDDFSNDTRWFSETISGTSLKILKIWDDLG